MNFFRLAQRPIAVYWIALLAITLVCGQSLSFHVHDVDHAPLHEHGVEPLLAAVDHTQHEHVAGRHLSIDISHAEHHDGMAYEIAAPQHSGMLQSSLNPPAPDLLLLFMLLSVLSACFMYRQRLRGASAPPSRRQFYFTPLLRAPPR